MATKFILQISVIGMISILFVGCTSTHEVRNLAKLTAANSSLVNSQLTGFAKDRQKIAELRADAIASLSEEVERQQATFDTYIESARAAATISGQDKKPSYARFVIELQRVSDTIQKRQQLVPLKHEAVRKEILAAQQALITPKKNLSTIVKKLGVLAKEPSRKDQIEFVAEYLKGVADDLKTAKKASSDAVETVKEASAEVNAKNTKQDLDGVNNKSSDSASKP